MFDDSSTLSSFIIILYFADHKEKRKKNGNVCEQLIRCTVSSLMERNIVIHRVGQITSSEKYTREICR